jgi:DNA adenine methylase
MAVNFLRRMGTKTKLAQEVIKHFPPHDIYIENFFGAGGVFFNKPLAKYNFLNDNCKPLIELFETAINKGEELLEALEHSPYSQRLFNHFRDTSPDTCEFMKNDDVLRAVRFLYLSNYSFLGGGKMMHLHLNDNSKPALLKNLKKFLGSDYIKNTHFTSQDFRKFFDVVSFRHESDKQRSFLYSDPPYLETGNMYGENFEKIKWKEQDVLDLFEANIKSKTRFAISEFNHPFILETAKKHNLNIIEIGERHNLGNRKTEILITNYECVDLFSML